MRINTCTYIHTCMYVRLTNYNCAKRWRRIHLRWLNWGLWSRECAEIFRTLNECASNTHGFERLCVHTECMEQHAKACTCIYMYTCVYSDNISSMTVWTCDSTSMNYTCMDEIYRWLCVWFLLLWLAMAVLRLQLVLAALYLEKSSSMYIYLICVCVYVCVHALLCVFAGLYIFDSLIHTHTHTHTTLTTQFCKAQHNTT